MATLARGADLLDELAELKRRRLTVVVLWGNRDRIIARDAFEEMCEVLGTPHALTVEGSHAWLIADPDTFGEVITNVVDIAMRDRARWGATVGGSGSWRLSPPDSSDLASTGAGSE